MMRGPSKVSRVGSRWMQNLILHPTSSLDRNLSKNTWRYVENTNKKVVLFMICIPKFILKIVLEVLPFLILKHFDWPIHDDMEFVLFLEGPF